ncbi:MAG TPA: hypothetical protein PKE63_14285, partial [Lacibacter sp.]|nr:hypothetical protein [Lacibacter sp.]
ESPLDENMIWVGTDDGNLQLTTDGGKTWSNLATRYAASGIPAGTWVSSIQPSRFDKNRVYATFDNHMYGDRRTYVAMSRDRGQNWELFRSEEFTGFAHVIREDLVNRDLLFLGTEMGLFATVTGGTDWFRMKNNIPWYALVRDIQVQEQTNDLVLATHGRGIIIVEDITPMRTITPAMANEEVLLLNNRPLVLRTPMYGAQFPNASGEWNGGNPSSVPPVTYYLKERARNLQLEVYDASGKLVQKLTPSNRKGYNKVTWNQRLTPPRVARGGQIESAAFTAPQVLPGTYQLRMKMNGKDYQQSLVLVHDSTNRDFSPADRQRQYEAGMELYRMNEELATLVDSVLATQALLKKNIETAGSKKTKDLLQEYWNRLETFRLTLVPPVIKGTGDLKRLRSDISDLYTAVVGQEAAPSNLQVQRTALLKDELAKAGRTYADLQKQFEKRVQQALQRESKPPTVQQAAGKG